MVGDILGTDFSDVSVRHLAEICEVGLLSELITLGCEDASTATLLERVPYTPDAREKINECKLRRIGTRLPERCSSVVAPHPLLQLENL